LGVLESTLVGLSYAKARLAPTLPETTFEQWVTNRFGRRLYEIFFKTYTEKVWGTPCTAISAEWAAQRIKDLSLTEAVRNALLNGGRGRNGKVITTLIEQFHYPRLGPGQMWERCEKTLGEAGNPTLRGTKAKKLKWRHGRIECVVAEGDSGEMTEFDANHFISSMPLRELVQALDPAAPDEVLHAAGELRYRDFLTVVLIVDKADIFPDNWIYVHSPEITMGRIQNYKNWSPDMVPDPSKTSLGLEYFLNDCEDMWSWPDERLVGLGTRECIQLGFIDDPGQVVDATVVRQPKAYPVYAHSYREHVETIRAFLGTFENLQTTGRNGQHRYNNQDHSMLTGVYAARNVLGENYDIWSVNTEQEYHEEAREGARSTKVGTGGDRAVPTEIGAEDRDFKDLLVAAFAHVDAVAMGAATAVVLGLGLFLASAWLLVKGGDVVGPNLSLLGHYLLGYDMSWTGALIGTVEAAIIGFLIGYIGAKLRNALIRSYIHLLARAANARLQRTVLDKI
jgi:protoporphyrinogen oxidase